MKKLTITIALTTLFSLSVFAHPVDVKTAQKVAATFLNNNGAKAAQLTDLSKTAGFPNLYIFTSEQSFVVMSADDCVKPILGYSLSDRFVTEGMPENLRGWLQQYNDEIPWGIENGIQPDQSTTTEWQDLKEGKASKDNPTVVVAPLVSTSWNQNSPYNMYCPGGTVTGCVATAMAQVMKYWNYPEQGQGSNSYTPETHSEFGELTVDFSNTTYDWTNMTNTYNSSSTSAQKEAVATLMYHCGVSVDMNYGYSSEGGSAATSSKVSSALVDYFKYSPSATYKTKDSYTDEQWIAFLQSELNESRPLFYRGRYVIDENHSGGHAFVCDGYDSDNYFHFNWGWGGSDGNGTNNGFWQIGALNPQPGGIGSGEGTFNLDNAVITWIEPLSSLLAPTISATAINGAITLEWEAITDATSYDIYRDNNKIATNITENGYTDHNVVSGEYYEYYVRSVSGTTRSNLSNRITKMCFYRDYTPSELTATLSENDVTLSWESPENKSTDLHYGLDYTKRAGLGAGKDTYWAEVFDPSRLTDFAGMYINKVSTYLYFKGNYKLIVYEGDPGEEGSLKLIEQSFTNNTEKAWKNIEIAEPFTFDYTKELWIILFFPGTDSNSGNGPATCGIYDDIPLYDTTNPERFNPRRIGESLTNWNILGGDGKNYSWLIRTFLTDGTYTFNIYDNGESIASDISETNFLVTNPSANTVHKYTTTTNYYGGESEASNTAGLALGTASLGTLELGDNDKMTVTENSTLTVNGTLSNSNEDNLILENGAQLIHNSANVKATVKKNIVPYSGNDNGWNFITSPVSEVITPNEGNGLLSGNYDLYFYEEPSHMWRNYKEHIVGGTNQNTDSGFNLNHKKGYLYANEASTTLQFEGTLTPSNNSVTITDLSHENTVLNGFNLVGNPFACNATVDKDFYEISGNSITMLAPTARQIAPCEGVMVKADSDTYTVTFSNPSGAKANSNDKSIDLVVTQGKSILDRARVRFGEGTNMEKFTLDQDNTQISLWQDGKEYAVAYAEGQDEMPINFKAFENGTYTLGIESNNLELDYLHLIDNLTGNDIDLLTTPSYTFESHTSDYASRFRLVFAPENEKVETIDENIFGFITEGKFQLVNDEGILQVVDLNGRVLKTASQTNEISLDGLCLGVYLVRFINGDDTKVQKIVID